MVVLRALCMEGRQSLTASLALLDEVDKLEGRPSSIASPICKIIV